MGSASIAGIAAVYACYTHYKLIQLAEAHNALLKFTESLKQRTDMMAEQSVSFMKIVHGKWDHDDKLKAEAKSGTVG
jgi:hypothetical protein